jgi:hypothetical protein
VIGEERLPALIKEKASPLEARLKGAVAQSMGLKIIVSRSR